MTWQITKADPSETYQKATRLAVYFERGPEPEDFGGHIREQLDTLQLEAAAASPIIRERERLENLLARTNEQLETVVAEREQHAAKHTAALRTFADVDQAEKDVKAIEVDLADVGRRQQIVEERARQIKRMLYDGFLAYCAERQSILNRATEQIRGEIAQRKADALKALLAVGGALDAIVRSHSEDYVVETTRYSRNERIREAMKNPAA